MAFDANLPANNSPISSAELRNQLNALKALIDDQANKLSSLIPVLNRDANGQWTLNYTGVPQVFWQIWWRFPGQEAWANYGETQTSSFPQGDAAMTPENQPWWQVKICGEDNNSNPTTLFSNVISFGPVPP